MKNSSFIPPPELQDSIASYGIMEVPHGKTEPFFSPPLAKSIFLINVNNGGKLTTQIDNKAFFIDQAVATGQITRPVYGQIVGAFKALLVFFKPTGMHRLFKKDLSQLTNSSTTLADFLGEKEAELLINDLMQNPDNQKQIEILNKYFIKKNSTEKVDDDLDKVLDYIHEHKGNVSVTDIEENSPYLRRTLERHFKKQVGLSPKVYAHIYQFKCLINFLQKNNGVTWAELAHEFGYYDQSHMSRYIKEYLNVSPNNIITLDVELLNYLSNR